MIKPLVIFVAVLGCLVAMGIVSQDAFMQLWTTVFVMAVKGLVFAAIPCGFLIAVYLRFTA